MVEKSDKFDEWQAICQSFPFQSFSCNTSPMKATIKVLLIKLSDMLDSSKFVRHFHHQSFVRSCCLIIQVSHNGMCGKYTCKNNIWGKVQDLNNKCRGYVFNFI